MSTHEPSEAVPAEPLPPDGTGSVFVLIDLDLESFLALPTLRAMRAPADGARDRGWGKARLARVSPETLDRYQKARKEWEEVQQVLREAEFHPAWEGRHRI